MVDQSPTKFHQSIKLTEEQQNPKLSSTILLVRDNAAHSNIEVLLIQRARNISFGEVYVFPGGTITQQDRSPNFSQLSSGLNDNAASIARQ
jgi:chemotaxis response regulator CheB